MDIDFKRLIDDLFTYYLELNMQLRYFLIRKIEEYQVIEFLEKNELNLIIK